MFEEYPIPHSGSVLSLTGLEKMTNEEKTRRITAIADNITASIIYIARQAEAGNLAFHHTTPIHNLIESIIGTERSQKRSLLRELEKQDLQISQMERQHRRDIEELVACANSALKELKARADLLEAELKATKEARKGEEGEKGKGMTEGVNDGYEG